MMRSKKDLTSKRDSHLIVIFALVLVFLALTGCSSLERIEPDVRQGFTEIDKQHAVDYKAVSILPKPVPEYEGEYAKLNEKEFTKLYVLYSTHKQRTADFNSLLSISNKQTVERNNLLVLAQDEQQRANRLSVALADERNARIQEQRYTEVKTVGISIGAILLLVLLL